MLLTDFNICVNGILYNLKFMYTSYDQSFEFCMAMARWWSKWL